MERSALGAPVWDLFEISEKKVRFRSPNASQQYGAWSRRQQLTSGLLAGQEAMLTLARHAVEARKPFSVDFVRRLTDGRMVRFTASFRCAALPLLPRMPRAESKLQVDVATAHPI